MATNRIDTVANFAFVMPAYDYTDIADLSPSVDADCVMYVAWGWDHRKQGWKRLGEREIKEEAREIAMAHHAKMCVKMGLRQDLHPGAVKARSGCGGVTVC